MLLLERLKRRMPMSAPRMQGGEEAAALLSQLEAPAGGEIKMNWNLKV
jgi:hypothetical protein